MERGTFSFSDSKVSCSDSGVLLIAEYSSLNRQLDDLDQALNLLERKSDQLNQEARQLLRDAKATRTTGQSAETATHDGETGTPTEGEEEQLEKNGSNTPTNTPNSEMDTS